MRENLTLCLNLPVTIPLGSRVLEGRLALPAHARELRVCIGARVRAAHDVAALNLEAVNEITSGDLLRVIDWVRSRRLLQPLSISLVTPSAFSRAALKAAHHRPACVTGVQVTNPRRKRHLTLAYSA